MQTKYKTLEAVAEALQTREQVMKPFDLMTTLNQYRIAFTRPSDLELVPFDKGNPTLTLTPNAQSQLLQKIGFNQTLVDRLPNSMTENCIGYLFANHFEKKPMLIRGFHGANGVPACRAVLTDEYRTEMPDLKAVQYVMRKLAGRKTEVTYSECTMDGFYMSLTLPDTETKMTMRVGDIAKTGLYVMNSETGLRSFTVADLLWQCFCTNQAVSMKKGTTYRIRHIGDSDRWEDRINSAIDSSLLTASGILAKLKEAVTTFVTSTSDEIARVAKTAMTAEEYKQMINVMTANVHGDDYRTKYGIYSAITETANYYSNEKALNIHQLAYDYLDRPTQPDRLALPVGATSDSF